MRYQNRSDDQNRSGDEDRVSFLNIGRIFLWMLIGAIVYPILCGVAGIDSIVAQPAISLAKMIADPSVSTGGGSAGCMAPLGAGIAAGLQILATSVLTAIGLGAAGGLGVATILGLAQSTEQ